MSEYVLVIHGGAVNTDPDEIKPEEVELRAGLQAALDAGWQILHAGGSALDAVEAAVRSLEDNEHFNAGRGSCLTRQGEALTEAAIMDGRTLNGGAVGCLRYVKNPVSLARAVMEKCEHSFLSADGALEFALKQGLEIEAPHYFLTEKNQQEWLEIVQEKVQQHADAHDTVGAVALDQYGNVAVATSTGGLEGQLKGRIGDSCLFGGGTYANNESAAISCTGDGEIIMRGVLAYEVAAQVRYRQQPLQAACDAAVNLHRNQLPGDRGIIAVSPAGEVAIACNTNVMRCAFRRGEEEPFVAVWKDEVEARLR